MTDDAFYGMMFMSGIVAVGFGLMTYGLTYNLWITAGAFVASWPLVMTFFATLRKR